MKKRIMILLLLITLANFSYASDYYGYDRNHDCSRSNCCSDRCNNDYYQINNPYDEYHTKRREEKMLKKLKDDSYDNRYKYRNHDSYKYYDYKRKDHR